MTLFRKSATDKKIKQKYCQAEIGFEAEIETGIKSSFSLDTEIGTCYYLCIFVTYLHLYVSKKIKTK